MVKFNLCEALKSCNIVCAHVIKDKRELSFVVLFVCLPGGTSGPDCLPILDEIEQSSPHTTCHAWYQEVVLP